MNLFVRQKQTCRHRTQIYVYRRGQMGREERKDKLEAGVNIYTLLIYKIDNQ